MGIFKEAFGETVRDTFDGYVKSRKERFKWAPLLLVFILLTFLAGFVKSIFTNGADILAGKATVEKYFTGNLARVIAMLLIAAAFVVVVKKTWKGMASSTEQLIFTVFTGVYILIMFVVALKPVLSIAGELKHPTTKELSSYTLCTDDKGMHYVAFNDDGAVLLAIPSDKYAELKNGNLSNKKSTGQAHQMVIDSGYKDVQYYESDLSVSYYNKSIIYIDAQLKQDNN